MGEPSICFTLLVHSRLAQSTPFPSEYKCWDYKCWDLEIGANGKLTSGAIANPTFESLVGDNPSLIRGKLGENFLLWLGAIF